MGNGNCIPLPQPPNSTVQYTIQRQTFWTWLHDSPPLYTPFTYNMEPFLHAWQEVIHHQWPGVLTDLYNPPTILNRIMRHLCCTPPLSNHHELQRDMRVMAKKKVTIQHVMAATDYLHLVPPYFKKTYHYDLEYPKKAIDAIKIEYQQLAINRLNTNSPLMLQHRLKRLSRSM